MGVTGQASLKSVEAKLRKAGPTLDEAVAKHLRRVAPEIPPLIRAEVPTHIPVSGGYAAVLEAALQFKTRVGVKTGMTMTITAKGKTEDREVGRVNRGSLRHPLFGNREKWYTTKVRRGFVDDGIEKAEPLLVDAVQDARDELARDIVR